MLGLTFSAQDQPADAGPLGDWTVVALPTDGDGAFTVALISAPATAVQVGAAMFGMEIDELDDELIGDALNELLNQIAGLMKSKLHPDSALGLPRNVNTEAFLKTERAGWWEMHMLCSDDQRLAVAVSRNTEIGRELALHG